MNERIPLVDLNRQHAEVEAEVLAGWKAVLGHGRFILGEEVAEFEGAYAVFAEVGHCVGVASGTDALELAVRALGLDPGDRVIVPVNSFIASALGVLRAGAEVVLVDSDTDTHLIDVEQVVSHLDRRVGAIMPVHLFGQAAPVERIADLAPGVPIIEDAAQSQGARRWGRRTGSLGIIAGTSFYPGKNIGAYGDAGAVLTDSAELAGKVRALRNWGGDRKYHHPVAGFNSRLDTLQAVVLSAKLARLEAWNRQRAEAARRYHEMLTGLDQLALPVTLEGNEHVWHLYVIRLPNRDEVMSRMRADGIEVGVHYPIPMHLQGALAHLGHRVGDFPVAEQAANEILSLPIFPGITPTEQEQVVESLKAAL